MTGYGSRLARRLLIVGMWAAATTLAGAAVWLAVSRLGWDGVTAAPRPMSQVQVRARLAQAPAVQPVAPRVTLAHRLASGSRPAPQPRPRSRSWQLTGGWVGVTCRGPAVELLYATPHDGWSYRLDRHGRDTLSVEFNQGQVTSGLVAHCVHGTPAGLAGHEDASGPDAGGDG